MQTPFRHIPIHKALGAFLCLIGLAGLTSCHNVVPTPTMENRAEGKQMPAYRMHNIGPVRVHETFVAHFADANQDGHVDLLVGGREQFEGFDIEWGDGQGNWYRQYGPATSMVPRNFTVGDIDRDGVLEVLVAGEGDQKGIQVWEFKEDAPDGVPPEDKDSKVKYPEVGDIKLKYPEAKFPPLELHSVPVEGGDFRDLRLADVNEDGWPDLIGTQVDPEPDGGIYVWLNNGVGGWFPGTGPLVEGVFTDLMVADVNRDGHVDIVAARRGGFGSRQLDDQQWDQVGGVQIAYGDGVGRWELEMLPVNGDAESVTVADVDGDGGLDIVAGLFQKGIVFWTAGASLGDRKDRAGPSGQPGKSVAWQTDSAWRKHTVFDKGTWAAVRVGDLDGDGRRELVAASSDGQGIGLWSWQPGGMGVEDHFFGFRKITGWLPDHGVYYNVDLGDVHNRGRLDVAAVRANGGVEVWSFDKAGPPERQIVIGKQVGKPELVHFPTAIAELRENPQARLQAWVETLTEGPLGYHFLVEGKADIRPIHTEIFPNNLALSRGRAESVAAWLRERGVPDENMTIVALGDKDPTPEGMDMISLSQNRRVIARAYVLSSAILPGSVNAKSEAGDLFHITENKAFNTINGIPEYKVGPGDDISLTMWLGGAPTEHKVTVQVNGTVSLPYQEALLVEGLTPSEIDAELTQMLAEYELFPRVDVLVLKPKSKTTTIFGEIKSILRQPTGPGTYWLYGKETIVDFISRTGGPTKDADMTQVQLIRDGKTIMLNLERAIKQGDWRENAIIEDGDTIFMTSLALSKRRVYVLGAVAKPGIVEFIGEINLLDAVSKSGGFKDAYLPEIRVLRQDRDDPKILASSFDKFMEKGDLTQNLALVDRDVVLIPSRPLANWNRFIGEIRPTISLMLEPISIYAEILTLRSLQQQLQYYNYK